jgi:hypothetical protein
MLPGLTLPASLRRLLDAFAGCFTKPTFIVFTAMVVGMIAQTGSKTVCGMLAGPGWPRPGRMTGSTGSSPEQCGRSTPWV